MDFRKSREGKGSKECHWYFPLDDSLDILESSLIPSVEVMKPRYLIFWMCNELRDYSSDVFSMLLQAVAEYQNIVQVRGSEKARAESFVDASLKRCGRRSQKQQLAIRFSE